MLKLTLYILLSLLSLETFSQVPKWYDESHRKVEYPTNLYFSGIAYGEVKNGENVGNAISRLKEAARVEAMRTIQVHVRNETNSRLYDEMRENIDTWNEEVRSVFDSKTTTGVDLEIVGLQVEAWKNPEKNEVVAFAYVKKSTLCRQMAKKVTTNLVRIETILESTEQQINTGQKIQARETIKKVAPLFIEIDKAQHILAAIDPLSDAESLQLAETKQLTQRYMRLETQLKSSINVYLSCSADVFGSNYYAFKEKIMGGLTELECNFVPNANMSDWAIYVNAPVQKHNMINHGNTIDYFCYVSASITITNTKTNQQIYSNQLKEEKGSHTKGYEYAAYDAYENYLPRICNEIIQQIQKYSK